MSTPERKPANGGDFRDRDDVPESFLATLRQSQRRLSRSIACPIVEPNRLDRSSIAEHLSQHESIAAEVRCGTVEHGQQEVIRRAKLTRQTTTDGQIEFRLKLDAPLPAEFEPYAMGVGPLDLWQFTPVRLGEMPPLQLPASTVPAAAEPTFALSAAGAAREPGAAGGDALEAKSDRVYLRWRENLLQIIAAQPTRYFDQPVVAHVEYIGDDNQYHSYRRAVTLEHAIPSGDGRFWGGFECRVPGRTKKFQIEVRPLAADELDLLDARQVEGFLGGQGVTMLWAEGSDTISAVAEWEDQQLAVLDANAAWFLLAARKGVR